MLSPTKLRRILPFFLGAATLAAVVAAFFSCGGNKKSVSDLYKFPGAAEMATAQTKIIQVQVNIDYKLTVSGGPAVSTGNQDFLLSAFVVLGSEQQVAIGTATQTPVQELPVTLTASHLTFDAVVQVPIDLQPGANGYALHFALKDAAPSLVDETTVQNLDTLTGGVQPGTEASTNNVALSLATTLAYQITGSAGVNDGSAANLTAYQALLSAVSGRLKTVESTINSGTTPTLETYAAAVLAGIKYALMNDQALQTKLTAILQPAVLAISGQATADSSLATSFTQLLKSYATDVSTALGTADTPEAKLFTAGTIDPNAIPDPATYVSVIFAPAGVTFADTDGTATIGGTVGVIAALSNSGIDSYHVYFGGEGLSTGKIKLAGNVLKGATPLSLVIPRGTVLPSGATRFWVYPVVAGKELDLATSVVIVNTGGTGGAPAAPQTVTATGGTTSNTVAWTSVDQASSYNLYYSTTQPVSTASNRIRGVVSPFTQQGLTAGVTYYYAVTSVAGSLESPLSTQAQAKTGVATASPTPTPGALAAPTGLAGTAGDTQLAISWNAVTGASGYNLYWSTTSPVTTSGTKVAGVTSPYTLTGLTNGTPYYYVVVAVNNGVESSLSTEASSTPTAPAATPPGAPTGLTATASSTQNSVTWTAVSGATSYNLYWSTTSPVTTSSTKIAGVTSPYVHTGLTNGTTYYYALSAVGSGGESGLSTQTSGTPVAPPAAPTGLAVTPGNTQNSISWTAVAGATSYNLYWSTVNPATTGSTQITGVTSPHVQTGLTNGTTYYYVVTAVANGVEGPAPAQVSTVPFAAPTSLVATAGDTQNVLTWSTVTGATSFNLYWSLSSPVTTSSTKISAVTSPHTQTGLTDGTIYYYAVTAVENGTEGPLSTEANATPVAPE